MYDFHYNFINKNFNAKLLFFVTDSLAYQRKPENAYEEFFKHKHLFDFSNFAKSSKFFDERKSNWRVCWIKVKDAFQKIY